MAWCAVIPQLPRLLKDERAALQQHQPAPSTPLGTFQLVPWTCVHPSRLSALRDLRSAGRLRHLQGLRTSLSSKIRGKKGTKYFSLFFHTAIPSNGPMLPTLSLLLARYLQKPFLPPFTSLANFNSSWALGFLTGFLHVPTHPTFVS